MYVHTFTDLDLETPSKLPVIWSWQDSNGHHILVSPEDNTKLEQEYQKKSKSAVICAGKYVKPKYFTVVIHVYCHMVYSG